MKTIIINGANGYVASHFIIKLLKHKYKVIALVRPSIKFSSTERIKKVLEENSYGEKVNIANLQVFNYSLLHKDFLIPQEQLEEIFSEDVDYFHFAASLKYNLKSKDEIFKINVEGVENSLKIYTKYATKNSRFFFIGTAYSCGKIDEPFQEKFYANQDITYFRNYYEQSKRFGENVVKNFISQKGINGHILRLSQVVGHNQSGVTKTDYGIFDFTKRVHNLASRYPYETVRVKINPEATQNLIPINTVVRYLLRAVNVESLPVIMNFVSKNQIQNIQIINIINKILPIKIIPVKFIAQNDFSLLERSIALGMSFTGNYIDTNIVFETKNLDKIMSTSKDEPNEHSVYKMLEYFINNLTQKKKNR